MVVGCENVSVDHDESLLFGEVRRASPKNISEKKGIVVIAPRSHSNSQSSTKCAIKQQFFFFTQYFGLAWQTLGEKEGLLEV